VPKLPLCEVFGYPADNFSQDAIRNRQNKLCPFKNINPQLCTKDKANDPLGVCSIWEGKNPVITCPARFLQDRKILVDTKKFLLSNTLDPKIIFEVGLVDLSKRPIGRIDCVLIDEDANGKITDFGALEIQAVYISGNIRRHFEYYIADPANRHNQTNPNPLNPPRPDWLSSVKRIVHQFNSKGTILINAWGKRMALVAQIQFYNNFKLIHGIPEIEENDADIGIFLYNHIYDPEKNVYNLCLERTIYIKFDELLKRFSSIEAGNVEDFISVLEAKARIQGTRNSHREGKGN
jgi:hypothetical protein